MHVGPRQDGHAPEVFDAVTGPRARGAQEWSGNRVTETTLPPGSGDRIEPVDIQQEMQRSYIDYAMSVIVGRALPPGGGRPQAGAPPGPLLDVRLRVPPGA